MTEYKIEEDYSIVFATYGLAAFIATVIIIFTGQLRADGQSKETIKSKKSFKHRCLKSRDFQSKNLVEQFLKFRICDSNRAKFISEFDCW